MTITRCQHPGCISAAPPTGLCNSHRPDPVYRAGIDWRDQIDTTTQPDPKELP